MTESRVPAGSRVALDAMAFVYHLEGRSPYSELAGSLFKRLSRGDLRAVASSLVLSEVLVPYFRASDPERATALSRAILRLPGLELVDVDQRIAVDAARLRAAHNLRAADAVHLATGLAMGAEWFLTSDRRLRRVEPEGIRLWFFDDAGSTNS
ncbi:MAG: type II toxin-antitoxin system VapC family toxin [Gemmatimonadetes bacterium]|nr:type II toxin-antitoxin system VapC family toxin [Gemmatimonadota bacterium]